MSSQFKEQVKKRMSSQFKEQKQKRPRWILGLSHQTVEEAQFSMGDNYLLSFYTIMASQDRTDINFSENLFFLGGFWPSLVVNSSKVVVALETKNKQTDNKIEIKTIKN